ncbi:Mo-co oxidoreductase dimerisation domain [Budvicia aquatica]|nr:Mo-co oxidoreductase dimerisation domain [Budvicia aquatica]
MHLPKEKQTLWGWAWGFHPISKVEVSLNAGLTWQDAEIESRDENSWQRFSFEWEPHVIGEFHIVIRASDREGNVQPLLGKRNQVYRSIIFVS